MTSQHGAPAGIGGAARPAFHDLEQHMSTDPQIELRDRIAAAVHADLLATAYRRDQGLLGIVPRLADAVLAVLPAPADRAAEPVCICGHCEVVARELRRMADEKQQPEGEADECCGAEPPGVLVNSAGTEWVPGDCWCTLAPSHDGEHRCQPCTDRCGAPGWVDEPAAVAQPGKEA